MTRKVAKAVLPPIPASAPSVLGAIPILRVVGLKDSNEKDCLGLWLIKTREIHMETNLALAAAWHTLWHEWTHAMLWDAGITGLTSAIEERLCDALASARVREMLDNPRK